MSSEHVVVPVDWIKDYAWCCEFIAKTSKLDPTIRKDQAQKVRELLKQKSPEMAPMSEVITFIKSAEILTEADSKILITAFNAKFKV